MLLFHSALAILGGAALSVAQLTLYNQLPLGQTLSTGQWATTTARAAYNTTRLLPAAPPDVEFARNYPIQLIRSANDVPYNLSIPHVGPSFWGFSIEMSVINQVLGKNSTFLNVPFLNLLENLVERAGGVNIRLGGNTQEYARFVEAGDPGLHPGASYGKKNSSSIGTTLTPAVLYTIEMFYSAGNISALLNNKVKWFMGIPFDQTDPWRLEIAEHSQRILGDLLLGLQIGNEPDFYVDFGRRIAPYTPQHYTDECHSVVAAIDANDKIPVKDKLIGPSTSGHNWNAEMVFETGWLDFFADRLYAVTVENYVHDNCAANYGGDNAKNPQDFVGWYSDHNNLVNHLLDYQVTAAEAIRVEKPLIMFETNTASCGGFAGISNSFLSAMWGLDYGMQMAVTNFTHGMLHVGGQNVFYNPFTASRTEHAAFNLWTIGPIFYAALIMAEAFGKTDTARIMDLFPNAAHPRTPAYVIYENDVVSKVALFNFLSDPTGESDLSVALTIDGGVPASVHVKYLLASMVTERDNITWAGQTFRNTYEGDGRLHGELNVTQIECDQGENVCRIPMPAPAFALVFFDTDDPALGIAQAAATHATTAYLKPFNTAKPVAAEALATSNGHKNAAGQGNWARTNFEYKKLSGAGVVGVSVGALVLAVATVSLALVG